MRQFLAYAIKAMEDELTQLRSRQVKLEQDLAEARKQLGDTPPAPEMQFQPPVKRLTSPDPRKADLSEFEIPRSSVTPVAKPPAAPRKRKSFSEETRKKLSESAKKRWAKRGQRNNA